VIFSFSENILRLTNRSVPLNMRVLVMNALCVRARTVAKSDR
jgi:hypothetical protein